MGSDEFKRRFLAFHRLIFRIAYAVSGNKDDAEDTTQEVYEKLWRQRQSLPAVQNDEAYIVTIAKNTALDRLRNHLRHRMQPMPSENEAGDNRAGEQQMENRETLQHIEKLLLTLPQAQQTAIRLRHFADVPIADIAQTMQLTEVNVRQLLSRARRTMKEKMEKIYDY